MTVQAEAFDDFVRANGRALLQFAYLLTRDSGRAEDLVQESLAKASRRWQSAEVVHHPQAYVRKIVMNEYLGWRRRRASTEVVGLTEDRVDDSSRPFDDVDTRDAMRRALGVLSPRSRAVLVLRYFEGLSDQEIGELLGCAQGTVRSLAARAFATLRAQPGLAGRMDEALSPKESRP
jgi:RNA polymerase sigma-70 factor (sigma-E family)